MKHVFISHAGKDSGIADTLFNDLKDVGHDVCIDLKELRYGDDTIEFMNTAITEAHTVIIIYSQHTDAAVWQRKEINAAVWNETAQDGGKVIVVKAGTVTLPPLLGPKLYGSLDAEQYKATLQKLCTDIASQPSATTLVGEALKENSANPFWRVRAEYFEEMPALMAEAFSPPVSGTFANWEEMLPCFLEGSRGTGKTMLLLSLRARILAARTLVSKAPTEKSKSLSELFGIYVRLGRGAICNAGVVTSEGLLREGVDKSDLVPLTDLFSQEFYLCLVESLVSELAACLKEQHIHLDSTVHAALVTAVAGLVCGGTSSRLVDCDELLGLLATMHVRLADYIRRKFIYREPASVPFTNCDSDLLKRVIGEVRKHVPLLSRSQFTILLDEYENLLDYQKVVVNSLVKLGPPHLSVKVARKAGTAETSATTVGQELQESHDYTRIPLIYSVEDSADFARYLTLLENMVRRTLASHHVPDCDLAALLPGDNSEEIPAEQLLHEVASLLRVSAKDFSAWSEAKKSEAMTYYREAAIYRSLYGKAGRRTKKRFSGHKDLAFVSSGVIRFFQEMVGMAYHLQSAAAGSKASFPLMPVYQSEAVHIVSEHNLSMLSRNVETVGETLKYFLLDLGDCLRQKLLKHSSEPEAGRIAIKDPEALTEHQHEALNRIMHVGVKEGVFQTMDGRPGIRPKHVEDPQPVEFNIARIFAPTLQISPRLRWPTVLSCGDLSGLLATTRRRKTKASIINRLSGKADSKRRKQSPSLLFREDDE